MTSVWLHGAGMNAASWGDVPGVALDLPGHGFAARADASVPGFADALMPSLPEGPLALIGHSLGGMVAIDIAHRLGSRCRALVLIDAPLWLPCGPFLRFAPVLAQIVSRVPGPKGIARGLALRTKRGPGRKTAKQAMSAMTQAGLRDAMMAAIGYDARLALRQITAPILALWAATTTITTSAMRDWFEQTHPTAQSHGIRTGHMAQFDDPDAVFAQITPFLEAHA